MSIVGVTEVRWTSGRRITLTVYEGYSEGEKAEKGKGQNVKRKKGKKGGETGGKKSRPSVSMPARWQPVRYNRVSFFTRQWR